MTSALQDKHHIHLCQASCAAHMYHSTQCTHSTGQPRYPTRPPPYDLAMCSLWHMCHMRVDAPPLPAVLRAACLHIRLDAKYLPAWRHRHTTAAVRSPVPVPCAPQDSLNGFMALGKDAWREARSTLTRLLSSSEGQLRDDAALRQQLLVPQVGSCAASPAAVPALRACLAGLQQGRHVLRCAACCCSDAAMRTPAPYTAGTSLPC